MINLDKYPELMSTQDLVDIGLYISIDATYHARMRKKGPDYIKVGEGRAGKILYPKCKVLEFLEARLVEAQQ